VMTEKVPLVVQKRSTGIGFLRQAIVDGGPLVEDAAIDVNTRFGISAVVSLFEKMEIVDARPVLGYYVPASSISDSLNRTLTTDCFSGPGRYLM
jgi:hypothetical protein